MKKIFIIHVIIFCCSSVSFAQNINTFAGTGTAGYTGDGGAAISAELNGPFYLCIDASGDLLIPDANNNVIRMINSLGIITTIAGNGTAGFAGDGGAATSAELHHPEGIAVDALGNIYFADHFNSCIRKINTSGIISTIAGIGGVAGYSGDGGPAISAELYTPIGVAVDKTGKIYMTDAENQRIRVVNTSGTISTISGNGAIGFTGDGGPASLAELDWPACIVIDSVGNIFFSDFYNYCIRKINTSGTISTIAGIGGVAGYSGDGGPATSAEMNLPNGIGLDRAGNLFVDDAANNCLRKISTSGIISTYAGNTVAGFSGDAGPASSAELNSPVGVVVNSTGSIFISDNGNNRIREVASTVGIDNITGPDGSILLFPVPAKDFIYVEMQNPSAMKKIMLYNIMGQKILETNTDGKQSIEMSTAALSSGVYILTVLTVDGNSLTREIEIAK